MCCAARLGASAGLGGPTPTGGIRSTEKIADRAILIQVDVSPINRDTVDSYSALDDNFHEKWGSEGDFGRRLLLNPTIFRLLGDIQGKRILDAGCGNGYLSRLMVERGAQVVGVEPATGPFGYAQRMEERQGLGITYFQRDLSRLGDLDGPFDAVVANMVFLDIRDWRSALANCIETLRRDGLLVYSLTHPVWVPGHDREWTEKGHVEISEYLNEYELRLDVSVNFHRPLSTYVNETIRLGCSIAEMAEPRLPPEQVEHPDQVVFTRLPNFVLIAARRQ